MRVYSTNLQLKDHDTLYNYWENRRKISLDRLIKVIMIMSTATSTRAWLNARGSLSPGKAVARARAACVYAIPGPRRPFEISKRRSALYAQASEVSSTRAAVTLTFLILRRNIKYYYKFTSHVEISDLSAMSACLPAHRAVTFFQSYKYKIPVITISKRPTRRAGNFEIQISDLTPCTSFISPSKTQ